MKSKFGKLFILLALLLIPVFALGVQAEETAIPVVYLDAANGADTNDGLTEATAVQTMEAAYAALAGKNPETQGKIVLVSDYTFTFGSGKTNQKVAAAAHSYEVVITGKTSDVCFYVAASVGNQSFLGLQGPTTFESITMKIAASSAYTNIVICGNGGLFKIGAGVQTGTSNLLRLMAGPAANYNGNMSLEVHSGSWQDLCAGAYAYTMNGNASLAMYGGSVVNLETTYNGKHNGDVSISIYGGNVSNLYGGSRNKSGVITGDITVYHYGGTVTKQTLKGVGTLDGTATLVKPEAQTISLQYDDRKDLEALLGYTAVDVRISNEQISSYKVGTDTKDAHVLTVVDGKLIAVGVGTADLTVGVATHKVTVTPATISMFMITGHSVGAGDGGSIGQSVVCEDGQVYSAYRPYSITSSEGGLGYGADVRAGCKNSSGQTVDITSQQHLDAFTAAGVGNMGEGSAFGYCWNQLTGEKVWILNFAVGGSCLNEWQTGVKGHATWTEYHYDTAVKAFGYAQEVVKNEIAAGHYTFGHMAMLYHNGVNYANYPGWTYEKIKVDYEAMWNGYKAALATDMDGDGDIETLEGLGLVPFYNFTNEYNDLFDKPAGYYMASSAEYPDVFLASNIYFNWMKEEGLSTFPTPNYPVQNGTTLKVPVSVAHKDNGGTSTDSVFCKADNMHPTQVVHNATGMQLAQSMYAYLYEAHETTELTLQDQAHNAVTSLHMTLGERKHLVPYITPNVKGNVTYIAEGVVSLQYPLQVVANEIGTGTITAKAGDRVLATVTVTVTENSHVHCVCGGSGANKHSCEENLIWTAWGDDAYEQNVLPFLSGNYYLVADITAGKSLLAEPGETIRICLNGHQINTGSERVANVQGYLAVTDCQEQQGKLTSTYTSKYAQIYYVYADAVLDIYGGITDPQGQSAWGASILNHGTTNVYGGVINGETNVLTDNLEARGGAIYILEGQVSLYGGTIHGGYATKGGAIYMDSSKLVIDGATITGGEASMGGNIYADYLSQIEIRSGLIENGSSKNQGGNLYLYTSAANSVGRDCSLTISGGTIQKGIAADRGSNIFATTGSNKVPGVWSITVTGGEILGGEDNIILRNNAQLHIQGGTITASGYSVQFERSSASAPTPVLSLKDRFTLGTVYMEAGKGLIRLDSETVSPVTVMGQPTFAFYGQEGTHTVSAVIDTLSLKPANRGFGYKASFTGDVQDLLDSFGYSLWLGDNKPIQRTMNTFKNTLTLRLQNFDIENYGSTKVGAKVFIKLTNGITVESHTVSYSMQDMVELIDADLTKYTEEQVQAVKAMLEGLKAPAGWNIPNLKDE